MFAKDLILSIVIVNYKTAQYTLECVRSIYAYPPNRSFEVIVLDNGSDTGLEDALAERFPQVRFFETGRNLGFAKANNLGIHNSHGKYVLLLNNDAHFTSDCVDSMIGFMESRPEVGVVGPRHIDTLGRFQISCGRFPTLGSEIIRKLIHHRLSLNDYRVRDYLDQSLSNTTSVDWLSGSCLLIRREALIDTGLLDERFFMYFEDVDFCTRIRRKGWDVQYYPARTIVHQGGASAKENLLFAMIENRRSQIYFSRKYYGRAGEALVRLVLLFKYGTNFFRWTSILAMERMWGVREKRSYTMALLAKKVILISLERISVSPEVPFLSQPFSRPKMPAVPAAGSLPGEARLAAE